MDGWMEERQIDWRRTNIWQTHQHSQWWDASATLLCHEQWTYCRSAKTLRFLALDRCFTLYTCYKLQPPSHILVSIISYGMNKTSCPNKSTKLSKTDEVHQKTRWNKQNDKMTLPLQWSRSFPLHNKQRASFVLRFWPTSLTMIFRPPRSESCNSKTW